MLWLALNFYQLPLDVFLLEKQPDDNPLADNQSTNNQCEFAVVENGQLAYCSQAAMIKGLEPAMKVSTAYALSSVLKIKQRSMVLEKNTLIQLATIAYEFSSQVCIYNQNTILLEVEASCRLFTHLSFLLKKLVMRLASLPIRLSTALSDTVKSAYLLSIYQRTNLDELVLLSCSESIANIIKISRLRLTSVPVDYLTNDLSGELICNPKKIKKMGIKTIGELNQLPAAAVGRRFGKLFLNYLYCLNGEIDDPQVLFELPEKLSIQRCFVDGLDTVEQILFPARVMLEHLSGFLKLRRVMAVNIVWRFTCFNGDNLFFELALSSEVQNTEQLMMLTRLKLQTFVVQEKIEMLFLQVNEFSILKEKQKTLGCPGFEFMDDHNVKDYSDDICDLMDKLNIRLGDKGCSVISISDEYLPEKLSSPVQWLNNQSTEHFNLDLMAQQPLWLLEDAKEIYCVLLPNVCQLNYRGLLSVISKQERIESGWWEVGSAGDNTTKRDYYIAQHVSGIHYWIYCDLNSKKWYVHGVF